MGFQRQGKQHLGFHNLAMKPEDLALHLGLHRCSEFNLLIIFILGAHSLAPLVNASTGTEAMFLLPVESEHIEDRSFDSSVLIPVIMAPAKLCWWIQGSQVELVF